MRRWHLLESVSSKCSGCPSVLRLRPLSSDPLCLRDGGLKRAKVKDSLKEEQQQMYSSIILGQNGVSGTLRTRKDAGQVM